MLEAADGNRFAALGRLPDEGATTGVVILPDVRGLYRFYEELALRFAERGYAAVAFDCSVARQAWRSVTMTSTTWSSPRVTPSEIQADVGASVAWLRAQGCVTVFSVGFCMGGRHSWLSSAGGHGLAGAVGFYGRTGEGADGSPGPIQRVGEMAAPILALQAGDDANISADDNAAFASALEAAGVSASSSRTRALRTASSTGSTRSSPNPRGRVAEDARVHRAARLTRARPRKSLGQRIRRAGGGFVHFAG